MPDTKTFWFSSKELYFILFVSDLHAFFSQIHFITVFEDCQLLGVPSWHWLYSRQHRNAQAPFAQEQPASQMGGKIENSSEAWIYFKMGTHLLLSSLAGSLGSISLPGSIV